MIQLCLLVLTSGPNVAIHISIGVSVLCLFIINVPEVKYID